MKQCICKIKLKCKYKVGMLCTNKLVNNGSKKECQNKDDISSVYDTEVKQNKEAIKKVNKNDKKEQFSTKDVKGTNKKVPEDVKKVGKKALEDVKGVGKKVPEEEKEKMVLVNTKENDTNIKPKKLTVREQKREQIMKEKLKDLETSPINGNNIINIEHFITLAVSAYCADKEDKNGGYASTFAKILNERIKEVKNKWIKPKTMED